MPERGLELYMPKKQRYCIFCGGAGLSKEHVWPVWTQDYMPFTHIEKSMRREDFDNNKQVTRVMTTQQQGHMSTTKARVVCKRCNNGWMSRLEKKAKPILIPLIRGEKKTLDKESQKIVAAWIAKTVMVAEFQ